MHPSVVSGSFEEDWLAPPRRPFLFCYQIKLTRPQTRDHRQLLFINPSSSTASSRQVLNRTMDNNNRVFNETVATSHPPLMPNLPQVPLMSQPLIPSGSRKDCIRLRGLPYEAQVEQILEFLCEHSKNIVFQGVHMVYNAQVS